MTNAVRKGQQEPVLVPHLYLPTGAGEDDPEVFLDPEDPAIVREVRLKRHLALDAAHPPASPPPPI